MDAEKRVKQLEDETALLEGENRALFHEAEVRRIFHSLNCSAIYHDSARARSLPDGLTFA